MKVKFFIAAAVLIAGSVSCISLTNPDGDVYNARVTVKSTEDNTVYFQLTDDRTLYPEGFRGYGKEVRALTQFKLLKENVDPRFDATVKLMWIDTIQTKKMLVLGEGENADDIGTDPIDIYNDWMTCVEDGYFTMHVRSWCGFGASVPHSLNLVKVPGSEPYEIELRHNANGDSNDVLNEGIMAFSLDGLPDTEGDTVKLKLKWTRLDGTKEEKEFDYRTRK